MSDSNIFKINKLKNHILISALITIYVSSILLSIHFKNYVAMVMIIIYSIYSLYKACLEYKAEILINADGVHSERNSQILQMNWGNIKTIQIKKSTRIPMVDCMIITDIKGEKIYIDYNIDRYAAAWSIIQDMAKKQDQNILFLFK